MSFLACSRHSIDSLIICIRYIGHIPKHDILIGSIKYWTYSNVIVFNITFLESGTRSIEYDFNINMILMKNSAYSLFIINLEINILTHYLVAAPLSLTRLFISV
jgi:hypothetical protein